MKERLSWLILPFMLLMISSCSIEKRHYTGGYHVEWFNSINHRTIVNHSPVHRASGNRIDTSSLNQDVSHSIDCDTITKLASVINSSNFEKSFYERKSAFAESVPDTTKEEENLNSQIGNEQIVKAHERSGKTLEEMTLLSFLIALMGFVIPWPLATLVCFVSALSVAIAGRHRIMRNREKYSGAGLAIAAMLVAVFGLILFLWLLFVVGAFAF